MSTSYEGHSVDYTFYSIFCHDFVCITINASISMLTLENLATFIETTHLQSILKVIFTTIDVIQTSGKCLNVTDSNNPDAKQKQWITFITDRQINSQ